MAKESLASVIARLEKKVKNLERVNSLNRSSVTVDLTDDISVDLPVTSSLFSGVEAGADATTALDKVARAARTYRQDTAPNPVDQPDQMIPWGSVWYDTSQANRQYRWEDNWNEVPTGIGALDPGLVAQIRMRFADATERDALIPEPEYGMRVLLTSDGLTYQFTSFGWAPLNQYIKKMANTTITSSIDMSALNPDPHLRVLLVEGTYRVEALLHASSDSTTAGIQTAWTFSGDLVTGNRSAMGPAPGSSDQNAVSQMRMSGHALITNISYGLGSSATVIHEDLLLRISNQGVLALVWAQAASRTSGTTVSSASRLIVTKLADVI